MDDPKGRVGSGVAFQGEFINDSKAIDLTI